MIFGATNAFNAEHQLRPDLATARRSSCSVAWAAWAGPCSAGVLMVTLEDIVGVVWSSVWSIIAFYIVLVIVLLDSPAGTLRQAVGEGCLDAAKEEPAVARGARDRASLVPTIITNPAYRQIAVSRSSSWRARRRGTCSRATRATSRLVRRAFFGTGAYTMALVAGAHAHGAPAATCSGSCPWAALAAMLVAVPFGLIALRVRRHTFVVITIAIFFIFQLRRHQLQLHRRHRGA